LPKIETAVTGVGCINVDKGRIISKNDSDKSICINEVPVKIKGKHYYCWLSSKVIKFPIVFLLNVAQHWLNIF